MAQNLTAIKGTDQGISIYIKEGNFETIKEELKNRIEKSRNFFKGAKVIEISGVEGKEITEQEQRELEEIITEKYKMIIDREAKAKEVEIEIEIVEGGEDQINMGYFEDIDEGKTKFIRSTVRSGQLIESDGNIVILGDVNPGGVLSARGNIVVVGALRGVANAGNDGNEDAIVVAFTLNPSQLRIANVRSRKSDDETHDPSGPEIASIYNDTILIEPYLTKR